LRTEELGRCGCGGECAVCVERRVFCCSVIGRRDNEFDIRSQNAQLGRDRDFDNSELGIGLSRLTSI